MENIMDRREASPSPQAIAELDVLLGETRKQGGEVFVERFRELAKQNGWDWFGLRDDQQFEQRATALLRGITHARYGADRLEKLETGGFTRWIFNADPFCGDEHKELDGVVLPRDHAFWQSYTPPLGWRCSCTVSGVDDAATAGEFGGDPGKKLPDWWDRIDPATGLRPGIDHPWEARVPPDLQTLVEELSLGGRGNTLPE
jgi:hypothetical protein